MSAFTDTAENRLIDWYFRGQALNYANSTAGANSGPSTHYIGLLTVAPSDATQGTEVSGGNYARVAVASNLANWAGTQGAGTTTASTGTSGTTSNNNTITFPTPSANWTPTTQVVAVGIYDALTGGTLTKYAILPFPKNVNNGDPGPAFPAGTLVFQWDN